MPCPAASSSASDAAERALLRPLPKLLAEKPPPPIIDPPGIEAFNPGPNGHKMTLLKQDILLSPPQLGIVDEIWPP